jgi:flagellar protein FlgJ
MDRMPISNNISRGGILSSVAKTGRGEIDPEKLKKACTEFEALFIQEVLKFMRQTIPVSGISGPGAGKEVYQSLLDQELGKSLAKKGGLRIGEMVYRQMLRKEEKKTSSPGPMHPLPPRTSGPEEK